LGSKSEGSSGFELTPRRFVGIALYGREARNSSCFGSGVWPLVLVLKIGKDVVAVGNGKEKFGDEKG
jgi:hypothetical protein